MVAAGLSWRDGLYGTPWSDALAAGAAGAGTGSAIVFAGQGHAVAFLHRRGFSGLGHGHARHQGGEGEGCDSQGTLVHQVISVGVG